ncbi:hypothetical protein [Bacillus sp. Marseille-Q3570]|uniref:hypothetical protein n=1 Tax=Bacillus sp. Marseille-Q3570 TaxID=2963522 RepID=UPI0021B79E3A|nr:hypothetical protein [Bacillus sp. Marseille-Q3570]
MQSRTKLLNATKFVGGSVLSIGIMMFLFGFLVNGSSLLISLSIGTIVGSVFIFLIGLFFAATEEMLAKSDKGIPSNPLQPKENTPFGKL